MARIHEEEADKYVPSSSSSWFQLKNDGDTATVQFLFADTTELDVFTAHRVKVNDKDRYVDCPREYGESVDVCPLCASGSPLKVARFVVMYDLNDEKVKIWERGKSFITELAGYADRYYPLSDYVFDIVRHGKPGDKQTRYQLMPNLKATPVDISQIEKPELLGGIVLDKTVDEMNYYLEHGCFPDTGDSESQGSAPVSRRVPSNSQIDNSQPVTRRSRRG